MRNANHCINITIVFEILKIKSRLFLLFIRSIKRLSINILDNDFLYYLISKDKQWHSSPTSPNSEGNQGILILSCPRRGIGAIANGFDDVSVPQSKVATVFTIGNRQYTDYVLDYPRESNNLFNIFSWETLTIALI
jgi:hypothetical protein